MLSVSKIDTAADDFLYMIENDNRISSATKGSIANKDLAKANIILSKFVNSCIVQNIVSIKIILNF